MPTGFGAPPFAPPLPEDAGGINDCAGTAAGVASVTGTLTQVQELASAPSGVGSVTGDLDVIAELGGTSAGVATVTGTLTNEEGSLSGTSAGVATVTGTLSEIEEPTGQSDGVASVSGALTQVQPLAGQSDGVATVPDADLTNFALRSRVFNVSGQVAHSAAAAGRVYNTSAQVAFWTSSSSRTYNVSAQAAVEPMHELSGQTDGVGYAEATPPFTFLQPDGPITGVATVTGTLQAPNYESGTPGSYAFVVPSDVYTLDVSAWGAGGGGGAGGLDTPEYGGNGGGGGYLRATIPVTPGETLTMFVGGGGEGGEGTNDISSDGGGGGGGFSGVKRGSVPLVIVGAGGGGGAGNVFEDGGSGGPGGPEIGRDGYDVIPSPGAGFIDTSQGEGGTQLFGGAAGDYNSTEAPQAGSFLQGGNGGGFTGGSTPAAGGVNGGGDGGRRTGGSNNSSAGGGGAGWYGGGGGGANEVCFGGGGGSSRTSGTTIHTERGAGRIGAGKWADGFPGGTYGNGGLGGVGAFSDGGDGADGYIYVVWEYVTLGEVSGTSNGSSTVQGTLDPILGTEIMEPIPFDLSIPASGINELSTSTTGSTSLVAALAQINEIAQSTTAGTSTVSGTLDNEEMVWGGQSDGTSTVTGMLHLGVGDDIFIELSGQSDGVATVPNVGGVVDRGSGGNPADQVRVLYQYVNVGVGFDPTDNINTRAYGSIADAATVSAQAYPDGAPRDDWSRFLYQVVNVGVAFDDTDNLLTRAYGSLNPSVDTPTPSTDQTFPDGNIRDDWSRFLYEYLNVIPKVIETGHLFIGRGAPRRLIYHPPSKPPVSRVGSRGPEVT